jgi:hypothetical protein
MASGPSDDADFPVITNGSRVWNAINPVDFDIDVRENCEHLLFVMF